MGKLDDELMDTKDFPWLLTLFDMLETAIAHCEKAQHAQDVDSLHANLTLAASALKAAFKVYGMRLEKEKTE